jgi:peptidoglycan/xylan/chitin deacetylase (PgdA/CDA1 family)
VIEWNAYERILEMFKQICWLALLVMGTGQGVVEAEEALLRVETDRKIIALTFDDGPNPEVLPNMLELFEAEGVKATFFMTGKSIKKTPSLVGDVIKAGHEIGNHSMTHLDLRKADSGQVRHEIEGFQKLVAERFDYVPKLFRAPYLGYTEEVWECLAKNGLQAVDRSIGTRDWKEGVEPEKIVARATNTAHPGAIVLMHERKSSFEALPQIIRFYKDKGYRFLTVSEMLNEK